MGLTIPYSCDNLFGLTEIRVLLLQANDDDLDESEDEEFATANTDLEDDTRELDEEDLEENDLTDEEADDVEWDESK